MHVIKFGGTSVGSADRLEICLNIIRERVQKTTIGVVLSAVGGVTNKLDASIKAAQNNENTITLVDEIRAIHMHIVDSLVIEYPTYNKVAVFQFINETMDMYATLLRGIQLIKECPTRIYCRILSIGERLSARIFEALLVANNIETTFLDAMDYIKTKGSLDEGEPLMDELDVRFKPMREKKGCLLMSGFIASTMDGTLSLLGRNGSDFSASLMAVGLHADVCEIWTDVDGIYTSDPNQIKDAKLIKQMSYGEAMELAFYGAKVLHPKTTAAVAACKIPLYIKNTFNPNHPGTAIKVDAPADDYMIRAVSTMNDIALMSISGAGMKGIAGIAARVFSTVSRCNVSIIMICQSSSECAISFCINDKDAGIVREALSTEFALEMKAKLIDQIDMMKKQSIICIVGDQVRSRIGVAGNFFQALSASQINILAIAQGSSERCISTVIDGRQHLRAMKSVHRAFFKTGQSIDVYLCGAGSVGAVLIDQIKDQQDALQAEHIDIRVCGISNSRQAIVLENGIDLTNWRDQLQQSNNTDGVSAFIAHARQTRPINGILVDCTTSEAIGHRYVDVFSAGLGVVTANKKANSDSVAYYNEMRTRADYNRCRFLYETNVGAGLPIIDTLKGLLKSGDKLIDFSGIMSGSLSYIFGLLDEGCTFSNAVHQAVQKKFTEPDPRDDLNGMDVARKVLIVAREAGYHLELSDIIVDSIFPTDFDDGGSISEFLNNISAVDGYFQDKMNALRAAGKVLRFVGSVMPDGCRVGLVEVDATNALYAIKGGENAFSFLTKRYNPIPLVVRGYGAGVDVTAAGLFADILRTVAVN